MATLDGSPAAGGGSEGGFSLSASATTADVGDSITYTISGPADGLYKVQALDQNSLTDPFWAGAGHPWAATTGARTYPVDADEVRARAVFQADASGDLVVVLDTTNVAFAGVRYFIQWDLFGSGGHAEFAPLDMNL